MGRVEPKLGKQRCWRPAEGLDAAQVECAFPGADGETQIGDTRRILEPLVQYIQYRPRDAGTAVQRFNGLGGRNHVEDDLENLRFNLRQTSAG